MGFCTIIGDSIALGLSIAMKACLTHAVIGAPASRIATWPVPQASHWMAISAGSNDPRSPDLRNDLERIRTKARSPLVIWILPVDYRARTKVLSIAILHGDEIVTFQPGRDHVHPRSYEKLAEDVLRIAWRTGRDSNP